MKSKLHVVQLQQLVGGKAAALRQKLEGLARGRTTRTAGCLKLLRTLQQLQECSRRTAPDSGQKVGRPPLTELRFILEQVQQVKTAIELLEKISSPGNAGAVAWVSERLQERNQRQLDSLSERAEKILRGFPRKSPSPSVRRFSDVSLRRRHTHQLEHFRTELAFNLENVSKEGITPAQLAHLRELLRQIRFLLEIGGELFELTAPFDARLLDECRRKLKKADQWQTAARLLRELEPEFNARPRTMARQWLTLFEEVQSQARKRARKLATSLRQEDGQWAGLRFALDRLVQKEAPSCSG